MPTAADLLLISAENGDILLTCNATDASREHLGVHAVTFPKSQLITFAQWATVPVAAEFADVPERTMRMWVKSGIIPSFNWCGMRIVRLKDVRLAVASPPKRGRKAKGDQHATT